MSWNVVQLVLPLTHHLSSSERSLTIMVFYLYVFSVILYSNCFILSHVWKSAYVIHVNLGLPMNLFSKTLPSRNNKCAKLLKPLITFLHTLNSFFSDHSWNVNLLALNLKLHHWIVYLYYLCSKYFCSTISLNHCITLILAFKIHEISHL